MGFDDVALKWFKSYLTNRQQYISISNVTSRRQNIEYGVPQGGVLAPQLFFYVINSMFEFLRFSNCILFADDTTVYVTGRNIRFLKTKLQNDLNNIALWLMENGLVLNVKKTKSMLITPRNKVHFDQINPKLNNELIDNIEVFKFLGV